MNFHLVTQILINWHYFSEYPLIPVFHPDKNKKKYLPNIYSHLRLTHYIPLVPFDNPWFDTPCFQGVSKGTSGTEQRNYESVYRECNSANKIWGNIGNIIRRKGWVILVIVKINDSKSRFPDELLTDIFLDYTTLITYD